MRLALINLMDVRPGGIDRSTLGHPGKFTYCLAEDEEDTTWQPLSVMRGMPAGASAVTVMAAMAPRQIMNEWTTDPKEILETFAAEMRANQLHYSIYGGNYAIVIPKQLREHIQAAGWSKTGHRRVHVRAGAQSAAANGPRSARARWCATAATRSIRRSNRRTICWSSPPAVRPADSAPSFRLGWAARPGP